MLTERLRLRQWQDCDLPAFARMNACPEVMKFFPSVLSEQQSYTLANSLRALIEQRGWGLWALEELGSGQFIGFTGLHHAPDELPCAPAVEIGWRLDRQFWGRGYATEAANKALSFAFDSLKLNQLVSFTSINNAPSIAVMKRIGLQDAKKNFIHPKLEPTSPLAEHVLYALSRSTWQSISTNSSAKVLK